MNVDRTSLYNSGQRKGFHEAVIKYILKAEEKNQYSNSDVISQIMEYFDLSEQEATTLVNEHWK